MIGHRLTLYILVPTYFVCYFLACLQVLFHLTCILPTVGKLDYYFLKPEKKR